LVVVTRPRRGEEGGGASGGDVYVSMCRVVECWWGVVRRIGEVVVDWTCQMNLEKEYVKTYLFRAEGGSTTLNPPFLWSRRVCVVVRWVGWK
jgi:hypothetical protein